MTWKMPKLELGEVDAIGADGAEGILYDEATIYFADDPENYSIEVECDGALIVAGFIVNAANNHDALVKALDDLQSAETAYRMVYDLDGYYHQNTLEARGKLRSAGYRAREVLAVVGTQPTPSAPDASTLAQRPRE